MKAEILVTFRLAPQDADLLTRVPAIIRERLEGTAVKVTDIRFTSVEPSK